jgi:hypothetical protein
MRAYLQKKTLSVTASNTRFHSSAALANARAFALSVYVDVVYRVEIPKSRFGELTCFLCILGCLNMKLVA